MHTRCRAALHPACIRWKRAVRSHCLAFHRISPPVSTSSLLGGRSSGEHNVVEPFERAVLHMTNYSEYLYSGYFLVKRIPRPDNLSNLLPDSIITVSNCFAETAPDEWCLEGYNYEDEERAEEASKLE